MRIMHYARWFVLALLFPLIPTSQARAGVFISVGFAPPVLPVYVQPPCPEPNMMWTPGYWAYDYNSGGYYWVPGAWVPAPYEGALWTPPYWGWSSGVYVFHAGYWGPHVGYYGGVNYGFGYKGVGFVGGAWHGREFAYNTAVVHVNETVVRNVYVDRTIVERNTIVNDRHVAYAGGPGGIQHQPSPEERQFSQERHMAPTQFQQQHIEQARSDRGSFFNANHGRPQTMAESRPLSAGRYQEPAATRGARENERPNGMTGDMGARGESRPGQEMRPAPESRPAPQSRPEYRPAPESRPAPRDQARPAQPREQQRPESHPQSKPPKEKEPRR